MRTRMSAARGVFAALKHGDTSAARLGDCDRAVNASFIMQDLYRTRNMRLAFKDGFYTGGLKAGLMTLTGGRFPSRKIAMQPDAAVPRRTGLAGGAGRDEPRVADGTLTFSKGDGALTSANTTRGRN